MEPATLRVKLTPKASRDRLGGMEGDRLKVYLTSPPVDGQANRALLKFLAKTLKTPPSSLRLAQGAASREKLILFEGLSQDELARRLGLALGGDAGKAKT